MSRALILAVLALALTACGKKGDPVIPEADPAPAAAEETAKPKPPQP